MAPGRIIETLGGRLLHARNDVAIGVEGRRDSGVSQALLDDLRMNTLFEQQSGVGVTGVVPIGCREFRIRERACASVGDGVWNHRSPVMASKHQIAISADLRQTKSLPRGLLSFFERLRTRGKVRVAHLYVIAVFFDHVHECWPWRRAKV